MVHFPREYMFKGVPEYGEIDDPVELLVSEIDRFNITRGDAERRDQPESPAEAVREHPDRFVASWDVDPNEGMEASASSTRRCASST